MYLVAALFAYAVCTAPIFRLSNTNFPPSSSSLKIRWIIVLTMEVILSPSISLNSPSVSKLYILYIYTIYTLYIYTNYTNKQFDLHLHQKRPICYRNPFQSSWAIISLFAHILPHIYYSKIPPLQQNH